MVKNTNISLTANDKGKVSWRSPSNIALVKYWGKKGIQLPANPSISMTLSNSYTEMDLEYEVKSAGEDLDMQFYFEGKENEEFGVKIRKFLLGLPDRFNYLRSLKIKLSSRNSFPHSAGIASSASSMSALALCILSMEKSLFGEQNDTEAFCRDASNLARQASGSACRSVYGGYTAWGNIQGLPGSDDAFAIPFPGEVHPDFHSLRDDILLVSSEPKSVSSRAGHGLMKDHPFANARYEMATRNAMDLADALMSGDMETFIRVVEQEALTLHGLMMASDPSYILLKPNSIRLIEEIRSFRQEKSIPVCFTIDAGPNIHLLYPKKFEDSVRSWRKDMLVAFLEKGMWIEDHIGTGPVNLLEN